MFQGQALGNGSFAFWQAAHHQVLVVEWDSSSGRNCQNTFSMSHVGSMIFALVMLDMPGDNKSLSRLSKVHKFHHLPFRHDLFIEEVSIPSRLSWNLGCSSYSVSLLLKVDWQLFSIPVEKAWLLRWDHFINSKFWLDNDSHYEQSGNITNFNQQKFDEIIYISIVLCWSV